METRIVIANGDMFEGSREQFEDCFFSNATDEQIISWCMENEWSLTIDGKQILPAVETPVIKTYTRDEVENLIRIAYVDGYENGYVKGAWYNAIEEFYKKHLV